MYNENGELVRDIIQDGDAATLYKNLRELLIILTRLDVDDMEDILLEKISKQIDGSEFSPNNCRSICWTIGAIAGAMSKFSQASELYISHLNNIFLRSRN
jgi:exportin-1